MLQAPPFTLYSNVEPVGQGVPEGAVMLPPDTVHPVLQALFIIVTLAGAEVKVGQLAQRQFTVTGDPITQLV